MTVSTATPTEKVAPEVRQLPLGWAWTILSAISVIKGGVTKDAKHIVKNAVEIPYLRVANVQRGFLNLNEMKTISVGMEKLPDLLLRKGDILFNEGGDRDKLGRGWVWSGKIEQCTYQNHVFRARLLDEMISPQFISWYGNTLGRAYFEAKGKQTTNLASINITLLSALPVPLPPLAEQRRIVTKIEELFSKLDAGVAELKRTRALLKRYRQSLLHAAVTGELSREWREAQGEELEDAGHLLAHLLDERRARWSASGKKGKYAEPQGPDVAGLPELPKRWVWASLEQQIMELRNGISEKPDGNSGLPILRISAVRPMNVITSDVRYLNSDPKRYSESLLVQGDLLFTRYNGNPHFVGVCGMVPKIDHPIVYPDKLMRARPVSDSVSANFIQLAFSGGATRDFVASKVKTSAGQAGISGSDVKSSPLPLPPLSEQSYIVSEVERRLSILVNVEATIEAELKRAESTRQGILRRAFAGQLVPQDAADEPASVLLERIQAERLVAGAAAVRATGKRGRKAKTAPQVAMLGPADA